MKFLLFYPALALVIWTFIIAIFLLVYRTLAVRNQKVRMSYYRVYSSEGVDVPERMIQITRNFSNLLEVPTLFYAVTLFATALNISNDFFLIAGAWVYVTLRVLHSLVHVTYNNVLHRVFFFFMSNIILIAMWLRILIGHAGQG